MQCSFKFQRLMGVARRQAAGKMPEFIYEMALVAVAQAVEKVDPVRFLISFEEFYGLIETDDPRKHFWIHAGLFEKMAFKGPPCDEGFPHQLINRNISLCFLDQPDRHINAFIVDLSGK